MIYHGHVHDGVIVLDSAAPLPEGAKVAVSLIVSERNQRALELLDQWMADESGYDEKVWPELKANLDRNRDELGARRLFDE